MSHVFLHLRKSSGSDGVNLLIMHVGYSTRNSPKGRRTCPLPWNGQTRIKQYEYYHLRMRDAVTFFRADACSLRESTVCGTGYLRVTATQGSGLAVAADEALFGKVDEAVVHVAMPPPAAQRLDRCLCRTAPAKYGQINWSRMV